MIALEKIIDPDAKKILASADRATVHSYRNPNNPPDAGSSLYGSMEKLEKLLHQEITRRIGDQLREHMEKVSSERSVSSKDEGRLLEVLGIRINLLENRLRWVNGPDYQMI